ncbi:cob(I)yrinic acid a,c-diamide adenosyltransferase [Marivivens niveibacter]|uniref:Corrinoid adenosyltransferase n=1 Tax=Marivivens niveibacter TaxID=1930667 RepID=A0A251WYG3_9RHOB|nr:cob(I)yrinic acid a,c-diamide adenosyltransferase [Marivivens niveibacter]OUD09487.1 cob(I)yrinic acid a,c-diamide adenosyltransferase [Marivivens niveibacter]
MSDENQQHAERMKKVKAARDKMMAKKTDKKGLIIVYTGDGKGKSTAGFGMIFRHIGHGIKCAIVQFIKGKWPSGERDMIKERFPDICPVHVMGEGFTWETQDKERDKEMAAAAWEKCKELVRDESNSMVLMDEINIALRYDYLDINDVVTFLRDEKPHMTHVVLTGRNAHPDLIEIADLVTEMKQVKHPFKSGIAAQVGVEY